jgi:hypothetical protein
MTQTYGCNSDNANINLAASAAQCDAKNPDGVADYDYTCPSISKMMRARRSNPRMHDRRLSSARVAQRWRHTKWAVVGACSFAIETGPRR